MPSPSRRKGPSVDWKITLPVELALNIENLFISPEASKPPYGARSALVTQLLQQHWASLPEAVRNRALGVT